MSHSPVSLPTSAESQPSTAPAIPSSTTSFTTSSTTSNSTPSPAPPQPVSLGGLLRGVHHIALNVADLGRSRHFYGQVLGLHELQGEEIPSTLKALVADGRVANFRLPDGTILDLFHEPDLQPPHPDPQHAFTRAHHFAFDIDPGAFDRAVATLHAFQVPLDHGPVTRPTGRGIYFFDPDGFMLEIRCDPASDGPDRLPVENPA